MTLLNIFTGVRPRIPPAADDDIIRRMRSNLDTMIQQVHSSPGHVDDIFCPAPDAGIWSTLRHALQPDPMIPHGFQGVVIMYGQSGTGKTYSTLECLQSFADDAANGARSAGFGHVHLDFEAIELLAADSSDLVGQTNGTKGESATKRAAMAFLESKGDFIEIPSPAHIRDAFNSLHRTIASTRRNATSSRRHTVYRLVGRYRFQTEL